MANFYVALALLVVVLKSFGESKFLMDVYPSLRSDVGDADCGEPVILTPYLEAGKIKEAQAASMVNYEKIRKVRSYAGYMTVNKQYNSNQFFWYFEAANNPKTAPVVLWLQGGPGASSLYGLFFENGPITFKNGRIAGRHYSWHKNNHVIYIDNPVGTGFSFTNGGFAQNETAVGNDLYSTLLQFFQLFPNLQGNDFYVTGESYAGKYVPAVSYAIHKNNANAKQKINFQGFAIGNGLSDPINQLKYGEYLYQIGLIDYNGLKAFTEHENRGIDYIKNGQWQDAYDTFDTLINSDVTKYGSLFFNLTGYTNYYNFLQEKSRESTTDFENLLNLPEFRRAIHVGNTTFSDGHDVQHNLRLDMMQSVAPWVSELLSHYRGVIYNGQLDIIIGYPLTENYLKSLTFSGSDEFRTATRHQWKVDGDIAGYAKKGGNLTEVLVRNAGHMVPADQPKWAMDLLSRLTTNKPFF